MDRPTIFIEDSVENIGFKIAPLMILYHFNVGYPFLDSSAQLLEGNAKVLAWDEESEKNIHQCREFSDPISDFKNQVFYHDIEADEEGNSNIALVNPKFNQENGIGIWLKFNKDNLPYLIQWRYLAKGDYVCGIEPANSFIRGRKIEKEEKNLRYIQPGEKINYRIEINILESNKDINEFREKFCK